MRRSACAFTPPGLLSRLLLDARLRKLTAHLSGLFLVPPTASFEEVKLRREPPRAEQEDVRGVLSATDDEWRLRCGEFPSPWFSPSLPGLACGSWRPCRKLHIWTEAPHSVSRRGLESRVARSHSPHRPCGGRRNTDRDSSVRGHRLEPRQTVGREARCDLRDARAGVHDRRAAGRRPSLADNSGHYPDAVPELGERVPDPPSLLPAPATGRSLAFPTSPGSPRNPGKSSPGFRPVTRQTLQPDSGTIAGRTPSWIPKSSEPHQGSSHSARFRPSSGRRRRYAG